MKTNVAGMSTMARQCAICIYFMKQCHHSLISWKPKDLAVWAIGNYKWKKKYLKFCLTF